MPFGYAPLTDREKATLRAAATAIVERVGEDARPAPEPSTDLGPGDSGGSQSGGIPTDTSGSTSGGSTFTDTTYTDTTITDTTVTDTVVEETVVEETVVEETVVDEAVAEEVVVAAAPAATTALTPENPVGAIRYLAVLLLIAGGIALLVAAVLMQRARATQIPAAIPRRAPQERGAQ